MIYKRLQNFSLLFFILLSIHVLGQNAELQEADIWLLLEKSELKSSSESLQNVKNIEPDFKRFSDSLNFELIKTKVHFLMLHDNEEKAVDTVKAYLESTQQFKKNKISAWLHDKLSEIYLNQAELDLALEQIDLAKQIYIEQKNFLALGRLLLKEGTALYAMGKYLESIEKVFQAADYFSNGNENQQLAFSYLQIGTTYLYIDYFENAKQYYQLAAEKFLYIGDTLGYHVCNANLGLVELEEENYKDALAIFKSSHPTILKSKRPLIVGTSLRYIGIVFLGLNELDSAAFYLKKALKNDLSFQYNVGIASNFLSLTEVAYKKQDYQKAKMLIDSTKKYRVSGEDFELDADYFKYAAMTLDQLGSYKESSELFKKHIQLQDSLNKEQQQISKIAQRENKKLLFTKEKLTQAEFEQELREEEIKTQQLLILVISIVAVSALFFAGTLSSSNRKIKKLNQALKEKQDQLELELNANQALLKEVHHRVKNNLQVISSMLSIQSSSISDKETQTILMECKSRILSMSLIHESLYKKEGKKASLFSTYIKELLPQLLETYHLDENKVELRMNIEDLELSLDDSIPCGLIINEVVTNTLKHAFPDDTEGEIYIEMKQEGSYNNLKLADNGIGIPEDIKAEEQGSFGFLLIYTLAEQLEADIKLDTSPKGTVFNIKWEVKKDKLLI